ncbi:alpha/beta hydrolase [Saccharospirillum mangrovi]|uniref:alpha/beta hydrolase n=1 Tax=Saccharospirillum mangrovi TaxID=2161747 RepID=UPI000D35FE45|nr:alpha/beta hydrolase [Saccharospirillum mangrovi]
MKITIRTLGELSLHWDDQEVTLPSSKRTRALLVYLALTARPHRRDRLCEILWDQPDNPRGTLRWSLSKIRSLVNHPGKERLQADRERVELLTADIDIDVRVFNRMMDQPWLEVETLKDAELQLQHPFLEGLDLAEQDLFRLWLSAERQDILKLRTRVLARLATHPELSQMEQLEWTRKWEHRDPYSTEAATRLLTLLETLKHDDELNRVSIQLMQRFKTAGIAWSLSERSHSAAAVAAKVVHQPKVSERDLLARQKIQFCTAADGVRIAYASIGSGTPIVKAANWLSHLEHDWNAPTWSPLYRELAQDHRFIRYDERGNGLSDWLVNDLSFDAFVADLETVVDASGVDKFALLGISQGVAVSIAYAVKYPERVSHLILFGGFAYGWRRAGESAKREGEALMTLAETGWGQDSPAFRQLFSSTFMPSADANELTWFNDFQRLTTSPENAARFLSVFGDIDVQALLPQVKVPTLVLHSLGDQTIPVGAGRNIAAAIPNASFIGLESDGHILLGREPASMAFLEAVRDFIAGRYR